MEIDRAACVTDSARALVISAEMPAKNKELALVYSPEGKWKLI